LYKGKYPKNGEGFIYEPYKIPSEFSDTAFLTNQVIKDLRKKNNSFFKHVSFLKPHPPYNIADPWFSLFKSKNIDLPNDSLTFKQLGKKHPLLNEIVKKFLDKESYKEIRYSELKHKDVKNIRKSYLAMCAEVDYYIGKILKTLEASNQLNNTMIIFTSDHGEMLGENNLWGKLGWWDSSFRIPLIIHTPGQKPNIINNLTESVDLVPTIIDWLGGEIPIDWNGQSLMPYITNKKKNLKEKKFVVFDWDFRDFTSFVKNKKLSPEECNLSVIRTKKWKYVHFPTLPPLLFNLKDDPEEVKNLANVKKFQNVKNNLLSQLLSHRMLHLERQLSNVKLTNKGPKTLHGPRNRKLKN
jgi:arylsulfatase A-like enzyme